MRCGMRKLAYLLLAVFWIAGLALWFSRPRSQAALPEGSRAEAAPVVPRAEALESSAAPARPRPAPAAHRQRLATAAPEAEMVLLHVSSSVGLPLLSVEGRIGEGEWQRADLLDGTLEIESDSPAFRLRAAGHLETEVPAGAREVVLVPDALLTIESPHLRPRVRGLGVFQHARASMAGDDFERLLRIQGEGVLAEFPDADHLLVAFSPARLAEAYPGDVEVEFACQDGPKVELQLHPQSGLRAYWRMPAEDSTRTAPLDLALTDEGPRPSAIDLKLHALDPDPAGDATLEFAWGRVQLALASLPDFPSAIYGKPDRTRLEGVPLGKRYAVTGTDSNGRFGRIEFVHDGAERTLVLQAPFTVTGRIVDARDSSALARSDVRCFPVERPDDRDWFVREDGHDEELGRFELHLPGSGWDAQGGAGVLAPPERFTLVASAKGHRSRSLEFAWDGKRSVELGPIALAPNARPLVLGSEELGLAGAVDVAALSFGDEPELAWAVKHLVSRGFGEYELELDFADEGGTQLPCTDLRSGERSTRPFTREFGELALFSAGGQAFAFRREKDEYRGVKRNLHAVRIECEALPDSGVWTIGWSGGGTWAGFRKVSAKGPVVDTLALPEMATELWWSAGDAPPALCKSLGGKLALERGAQALLLR